MHPDINRLFRSRFERPTEIQERAFSLVESGRNVLVIAPTGYGKTEAAVLPIMSRIMKEKTKPISLLYITPLRALNRDIFERVFWWADQLGITISLRHGDTPNSERAKQARKPPQILVTTPETLQSILPARVMGRHLSNVKWVVVDELHELLESKRGSQLSIALERLRRKSKFQTIALSATIGNIKEAKAFVKADEIVSLGKSRKMDISVEMPEPNDDDNKMAEELGASPNVVARFRRIHELVEEYGAVLAFVNTRSMAELLSSRYAAWDAEHNISVHHSSLSKDVRLVAEKRFKDGGIKGLVATSSLELGIDIGRVNLVLQYMSPRQVSRLVQRVGRSGHSIHKIPKGIVIASDPLDALEAGVIASFAKKQRLEPIRIPGKPLDVLAHQLVGLSLELGKVRLEDSYNLVRGAYPYRDLEWEEFLDVLKQLENERLIWLNEDTYKARRAAFKYYFTNLSTIPDEEKIWVKNRITGKNIGVLDEVFVSENLYPGAVFITKGAPWAVVDITEKEVLVEPSSDITAAIPDWAGEDIPVPDFVAGQVFKSWKNPPREIDENARRGIESFSKGLDFIPSQRRIIIERTKDHSFIHAPFGTLVNNTIATIISAYASLVMGRSVSQRASPYAIAVDLDPEIIKKALTEVNPENMENFISLHISRSPMFKARFVHVARRFGLISKDAEHTGFWIRRIIGAMSGSPVYNETLKEIFSTRLDMEGTKEILAGIQSGKIEVEIVKGKRPSKLAGLISQTPSYFLAERPTEEIVKIVKDRIMNEYVGLECMNCKNLMYIRVSELPEKPRCRKCGGSMLALADYPKKDRTASLISAYGKRAVIALLGRGIGPETASRILARLHRDLDSLLIDIVEEERRYARTRRFWD